jgi:AraC-like DNA-binding protein
VLLKEGDRKLTEIASAVGYDSDGSFNKTFKRILGVTPGEYRRAGDQAVPESPTRRPNSNDISFKFLRLSEQPTAVVHETIGGQVHW